MHRICLLFFSFVCITMMQAQYYSPYQSQQAYEWGRQLGEQQRRQQQANQQAYNMGRACGLVQNGYTYIYNGDYVSAVEAFQEAVDLDYVQAYECLGICYELGIGCKRDTKWADLLYEAGADLNSSSCKKQIRRINREGHKPASYRETYLRNFKANYRAMYGGNNSGGYSAPSFGNGNVDVDHSCRACNNTGDCNGCHGTGFSYGTTRCNMCHGTGKCMNCGGHGRH